MTEKETITRIDKLVSALGKLTNQQLDIIEDVVHQFRIPFIEITRNSGSDLIDDCVLSDFGDVLRIHHCFSKESLSKDRFEFALEKLLNQCGKPSKLAPTGNPGHDLTIEGVPCSLKTQADSKIKADTLHVSKFMELGKGKWSTRLKDLEGLRDQFFKHMTSYDRIFSLRCLSKDPSNWHYELVEIPKQLLKEASSGKIYFSKKSRQSPKPGYCDVKDPKGDIRFQLYFDGGTERKLQVKSLQKSLCVVHATWIFSTKENKPIEPA